MQISMERAWIEAGYQSVAMGVFGWLALAAICKWKPFQNSGTLVRAASIGGSTCLFSVAKNFYMPVGNMLYLSILGGLSVFLLALLILPLPSLFKYARNYKRRRVNETRVVHAASPSATRDTSAVALQPLDTEAESRWWEQALQEYEQKSYPQGLWARCFAASDGNEARTKALYLKERAAQLKQQNEATFPEKPLTVSNFSPDQEPLASLSNPIYVGDYMRKYRVTEKQVRLAVVRRRILSELVNEELWLEDQPFSK